MEVSVGAGQTWGWGGGAGDWGERATAEGQGSESPYPPFLLEEFLLSRSWVEGFEGELKGS